MKFSNLATGQAFRLVGENPPDPRAFVKVSPRPNTYNVGLVANAVRVPAEERQGNSEDEVYIHWSRQVEVVMTGGINENEN